MSSLVSIIIPTYNRAHKIQKAIDSILTQTYQNFEIIIVDDGSEDNTKDIIDDLSKKDSRIHYFRHLHRKGANTARNRGILEAKGKYIAFQDSDDQWLPQKLSIQMCAIQNTGVRAVFSGFWRIKEKKRTYIPKKIRNIKPGIHSFHKKILAGNFIGLPTLLVEKDLLHQAGGFDNKLPQLQDWEMLLRLSVLTKFMYINQPLVKAYLGSDNITGKKWLYRNALEFIIEKHREDFESHPIALSIQFFNLAVDALKGKEFKKAIIYIILTCRKGITTGAILAVQKIFPYRYSKKSG